MNSADSSHSVYYTPGHKNTDLTYFLPPHECKEKNERMQNGGKRKQWKILKGGFSYRHMQVKYIISTRMSIINS